VTSDELRDKLNRVGQADIVEDRLNPADGEDAVIIPTQTRGAVVCSAVAGITAINAVVFAERMLADIMRGMVIGTTAIIHTSIVGIFFAGTILGSSALAQVLQRSTMSSRVRGATPRH
jgi:hypothetical protein